jgi:hypothetical protein
MARFEDCFSANNISKNLRGHHKKWLQFYLYFCSKYRNIDVFFNLLNLITTQYYDRNGAFRHFRKFKNIFDKTAPNGVVSIIDSSRLSEFVYRCSSQKTIETLIHSKQILNVRFDRT